MSTPASLPALFDPLLDYLASILPPQLYAALALALTQSYSLISSLLALAGALLGNSPATWDLQTVLPPLITLLAAYLALLSFYRTAGWMLRLAFAFVKWGFVLTTLGAAAGYILAHGHPDGALAPFGQGLLPSLAGMFLDMFNDGKQHGSKSKSRSTKKGTKGKPRPNAWETWEKQYEWQYSQTTHTDGGVSVQQAIRDILGSAGKAVAESGWWEVAKGAYDKATNAQAEEKGEGRGKSRSR